MIDFGTATREETLTMSKIADRFIQLAKKFGTKVEKCSLMLDIECAHARIPMRLDDLLIAKDGDFAHDIGGIRQNINRATGEIEGGFCPRYARTQS